MGKIVVSENVTLDGVTQDPAGDEGFRAGGWVGLIGNSPQLAKLALDEALAAGAFLLGRRSYEWLAARRRRSVVSSGRALAGRRPGSPGC
jgi:hypothetical protein